MAFLGGLGLSLSLVFGCLLLALVGELYYLLWWKKQTITNNPETEDDYSNYAKELIQLFCWKRPSSLHSNNNQDTVREPDANGHEPDPELGLSKDLLQKAFGEESVESELKRLHNLAGPPRFLFTIKEETKEDMDSEDGKSRGDRTRNGSRARSLSDLIVTIDTPFLTPLASPPSKSSPLNSYSHLGFNPLFESSLKADLNMFTSSPPPKFKFLRDAEEKLLRRLMREETEKEIAKNGGVVVQDSGVKTAQNSAMIIEQREGSFLSFLVGKNRERVVDHHVPPYPSSSSQVLPLASSPTTFSPLDKGPIVH
ncbi:hypothetical protein CFOL_v3_01446 [Cephalotus follicularis]|uniref:Uncharacterized protein n=1 Tax=Cephalotus follicularis TaxID=3775 RepID=A0A1Q3AQJ4_CEPFO|nr:hypothetical protein CFOL_v3_01446 [Cephalotus follicularis]